MPQEADKPTNVSWREQFPFAHEYVRESVFDDLEYDPDFPRDWDHLASKRDVERSSLEFKGFSVVSAVASSNTPLEICTERFTLDHEVPIFYWEVEIDATSGHLVMDMGFKVYDYIDGVKANMYQSPEPSPIGVTEVIGCGISYPSGVFSTRNGHLIDLPLLDSHLRLLEFISSKSSWIACGYLRLRRCPDRNAILQANLGQRPFAFDITGYYKSSLCRIRHLCNTLPLELLEIILTFMLHDVQHSEGHYHSCFHIHCAITRVSLVCRRWRTVAQRQVIEKLDLRASTDVRRALALPLLWNCSYLDTGEDVPWIHTFLLSALPHRLTRTTEWECASTLSCIFGQGLPGRMSHAIPALLRRGCFTNITDLTLSGLRFQSWLQFARFVLSFQQLDELSLAGATWDGNEASPRPPHWIRVARRIRRIWFEGYKHAEGTIQRSNFQSGLLCLLFTGRRVASPPTSNNSLAPVLPREEIGTVTNIAHHVCCMTRIDYLRCEQISPTYCTVSGFQSGNSGGRKRVLILTFMQHPKKPTSQLVHISVRVGSHCERLLKDKLFKPLTQPLSTLSNCSCNFDFSSLVGEYRLLSRVYMHEAVSNGLRVNAATYDDYEAWEWEDGDELRSGIRVRRVAVYKQCGDTITVVWDIPRSLRNSRPQFMLSVKLYNRDTSYSAKKLSEDHPKITSPARYIAAIDVRMVDVILPPQTEQTYFEIIVTYNGHRRYSEGHKYANGG